MAYYMTPLGDIIIYPEIEDRAFLSVSPLTFVNKLMVANPNMPVRVLISENIKYTFMGLMHFKQLELSPMPDIRAQRAGLLQRWESSLDWRTLRFLLDGDSSEGHGSELAPFSQPGLRPSTFFYGALELRLPPTSDYFFAADGLDVERFIEALRMSNHMQQELLDVEAIPTAVEQFALQAAPGVGPGVTPGLVEQSLAQLSRPQGVRALNDHSRWLTHTRQKMGLSPLGMQTLDSSHREPSNYSLRHSVIPSGSGAVFKIDDKRSSSSTPSLKKKPRDTDDMKHAMSHIPEIHFMDKRRRSRILSKGCSLHVSLPQESTKFTSPQTVRTHLHYISNYAGPTKLEIVPSYNRAIVVEFENATRRDAGFHQIASTKFSYGPSILRPIVKVFEDSESTYETMWFFTRSVSDHSHSVHEALRRFFCLQGHVPLKDFVGEQASFNGWGKIEVDYRTCPVWLQKLAAGRCKDTVYEVRDARSCNLCEIKTARASYPMNTEVTQVRYPLVQNSRPFNGGSGGQLTRPVATDSGRLSIENQQLSPALPARKRSAEEMDTPEDGEIAPKREQTSDDMALAMIDPGVESSDAAEEFLDSLGKELEGSGGLEKGWVKV